MTCNLKEKCSSTVLYGKKIIKKYQSFGSETQFPFKHVTDASFLAFGGKKKKNTIKKKFQQCIFSVVIKLQISIDQNQQNSLTARVKATLTFDPNLQHL